MFCTGLIGSSKIKSYRKQLPTVLIAGLVRGEYNTYSYAFALKIVETHTKFCRVLCITVNNFGEIKKFDEVKCCL